MLKIEQLTAGYNGKKIIENVNWQTEEGKLSVLVGPNGSGKSTLIKSIMRQTKIFGGRIILNDNLITELGSRDIAKQIAYLPQNRSDAHISVGRMVLHGRFPYIVYPRHYTQNDENMVDEALIKMGISHLKYRTVSELSGGEKQKAYLAMAIVQNAPIVLLDEPNTYLDISCQLELMDMLKSLADEGKTVVTVLHDLNHALMVADRILVMHEGHLIDEGTPEEVLNRGGLQDVFNIKINTFSDQEDVKHYYFGR